MDTVTPDVTPASSPAEPAASTFEVPREPAAYQTWRQTGKIAQPKTEESATSKEPSAPAEKQGEKSAPASEAGNKDQEKKPRDNAASRLTDLLSDMREAGLSPAELKAFKQNYQRIQKQEQSAEPQNPAAPEKTDNPGELKAPVKPKLDSFKTYEEYEAARDAYFEQIADYKAAKKLDEYLQQQRQEAVQKTVREKMEEAKARYGDEATSTISSAARAIAGDQQIPAAVKSILDGSPVWTDVLYTLGSKPEELQGFIELAKSDPGQAIRKAVLLESLVTQELSKGAKPAATTEDQGTPRDDSGKFTKSKATPERRESDAPPPPREVSGRGTPPPDEVESSVKTGDFRAFMRAQNARDLQKRQGK